MPASYRTGGVGLQQTAAALLETMNKEELKKLLITLDDRPGLTRLKTLLIEKIKTAS